MAVEALPSYWQTEGESAVAPASANSSSETAGDSAKRAELAASLTALRDAVKASEAAAKEAENATTALEVTRNAMKGKEKAVQRMALGMLEAQQREKVAAQEAVMAAAAVARKRVDCAVDALRTDWEQWELLHTRGYIVESQEQHGMHMDTEPIGKQTKFGPIFNDADLKVGQSSHRLQGRVHKQGGRVVEGIKSFETQSNELLDRRGWRRTACHNGRESFKKPKDAYALRAVADCSDAMQFVGPGQKARFGCTNGKCKRRCDKQLFHGDSAPPNAFHDERVWAQWCRDERNPSRIDEDQAVPALPAWGDVPLVMLYATQHNTPFCVRPFNMGGKEIQLILNAGDLIIFRGDLSHAGAEFTKDNLRIHICGQITRQKFLSQ
uniref:Uncharacterized protein n=1 Tax=Prymnesium polylepis TaxID=72548 RepID=A0A7S4JEM2_9EUKA